MARGPTRSVSRAVRLRGRVLHAALLGSGGRAAGESQRRLRGLRGRARTRQHSRDPPVRTLHPSSRVRPTRAQYGRIAVLHVLRLVGGDANSRGEALPRRARRQAPRRESAQVAGGAAVSTEEKDGAPAYLVI